MAPKMKRETKDLRKNPCEKSRKYSIGKDRKKTGNKDKKIMEDHVLGGMRQQMALLIMRQQVALILLAGCLPIAQGWHHNTRRKDEL